MAKLTQKNLTKQSQAGRNKSTVTELKKETRKIIDPSDTVRKVGIRKAGR